MKQHINKILRKPWHVVYITDNGSLYTRISKTKLKRLLQSNTWINEVSEIDSKWTENYSVITWRDITKEFWRKQSQQRQEVKNA